MCNQVTFDVFVSLRRSKSANLLFKGFLSVCNNQRGHSMTGRSMQAMKKSGICTTGQIGTYDPFITQPPFQYECCGVDSYRDWTRFRLDAPFPDEKRNRVPASCCNGVGSEVAVADCQLRPYSSRYANRVKGRSLSSWILSLIRFRTCIAGVTAQNFALTLVSNYPENG